MIGFIPKLKRFFTEPKIYALVLQSPQHGAVLHLGIHYSLDEAVQAATPALTNVNPEEAALPRENVSIDMWTSLSGQDVVKAMIPNDVLQGDKFPTRKVKQALVPLSAIEQIKVFKESKNQLMQTLIKSGDFSAVDKATELLSKSEKSLIIERIMHNNLSNEKTT